MRIIPQQNQIAASRVSCRRRRQTANGGHLEIKMASGGDAPTTILKKQPPTVESLSLSQQQQKYILPHNIKTV